MNSYDRSSDVFGIIDNLINPWNSLSNAHARNTSKMESFESHLSSRLTYTLGSQCTNGLSRFNNAFIDLFYINLEKQFKLRVGNPME